MQGFSIGMLAAPSTSTPLVPFVLRVADRLRPPRRAMPCSRPPAHLSLWITVPRVSSDLLMKLPSIRWLRLTSACVKRGGGRGSQRRHVAAVDLRLCARPVCGRAAGVVGGGGGELSGQTHHPVLGPGHLGLEVGDTLRRVTFQTLYLECEGEKRNNCKDGRGDVKVM